MKINKTELLKALEIVKPGLARQEFIEQSTSFAFMSDKIVTYNDEISIQHPVNNLNITGAIKAEELYQLLNRCKKEEIEIMVNDKELLVTAGRMKAGITLQQEIQLPLEEVGDVENWKKLPEDFITTIKFVLPTCSSDMSRPVLTCINVDKTGKIESSDNSRITRCTIQKMPVNTFLLPATTAANLIKYKPVQISEGKGWVHFKTDEETVFSCRVFEDKFPNVNNFLQVTGTELTLPEKLQDALDRAAVFSKTMTTDQYVSIKIKDKKLQVVGKGDYGWLQEELNIKYKGIPIEFMINPEFLKQAKSNICIVGERSVKFTGENWEHVIILVNY